MPGPGATMPTLTAIDDPDGRPHAPLFEGEPRVVRLTLGAAESVAPHRHPDTTVLLHVLSGHLAVALDGESHEVTAGEVLRFSGEREVAPTAREPTTALVVIAATD